MTFLHLIQEYVTNGYNSIYLLGLSCFAIVCASLTIVSKNPVVSVLYLIGLFLGIAVYLISLGLTFIGISYLLVYIGAVSILFLFIVMLINIRISELLSNTLNSLFLGLIVITILNKIFYTSELSNWNVLYYIVNANKSIFVNMLELQDSNTDIKEQLQNIIEYHYSTFKDINRIAYTAWEKELLDFSHITCIGNLLYSSYSIWLMITSIILLLAMVGAIVITIKLKK